MLPVIVRVENLETRTSVQHVFRRSPVHIGRNKLNELPLSDGFVSLWHGIIRFDEDSQEYLDLDSTNGTEVDGHRVRRNVFVSVKEETDLRIGPLRLHVSRAEAPAAEVHNDVTLFGQRTLQFGMPGNAARSTAGTVVFKPKVAVAPVVPLKLRATPEEQSPGALAGSMFLLYENYRQAWRALHTQLSSKLGPMGAEKRAATLQLLRQRFPALEQEEQFRALGENPVGRPAPVSPEPISDERAVAFEEESGSSSPTLLEPASGFIPVGASPARVTLLSPQRPTDLPREDQSSQPEDPPGVSASLLRLFAQTYGSESAELPSPREVEQFLQQLAAVLEAFAKAFLELRRGHDQFGKEAAVPVVGDRTPLRHAKNPRDVLRYLLDCNGHGAERIRALTEGFADVMIHQVALLNGVRQGVGALLAYLGPDELQRSFKSSRNGASSILKAWPFRTITLWRHYVARHQELVQEEKAVQSIVFGSEFALAYAQIVGGNLKPPSVSAARTTGGTGQRGHG